MKWSQIRIHAEGRWLQGTAARNYIASVYGGEYFSTKLKEVALLVADCVTDTGELALGKPLLVPRKPKRRTATSAAQPIWETLAALLGEDEVEVEGYDPPKPVPLPLPPVQPPLPPRLQLPPSVSGQRATPNILGSLGPCHNRICYGGTTLGLEYELRDLRGRTHIDKPMILQTVARAPGSKFALLAVTRDIYQGTSSVAEGTVELITGPISAEDAASWVDLWLVMGALGSACAKLFRDQTKVRASQLAPEVVALAGLPVQYGTTTVNAKPPQQQEKKKEQKKTKDEDDWGEEEEEESPSSPVSLQDLVSQFNVSPEESLKQDPELVTATERTPALSATPQLNIGIQLAQLATGGSEACTLLTALLAGELAYPACVAAAPGYWIATGLLTIATPDLYGVFVVYGIIVNKLADSLRGKGFQLTRAAVAGTEFRDVDFKNSWGALPKVVPAQLWQAVSQAPGYKKYVESDLAAAAALFAQHFAPKDAVLAARIFEWMWANEAFSPAPKPVPWFCIKNKPAVVFELRGSCRQTNAFVLNDGYLLNPNGVVMAELKALAK